MDENFIKENNLTKGTMKLIFDEVHKKFHSGLGPQTYLNGINLAGFCATGITEFVQEKINACQTFEEQKW